MLTLFFTIIFIAELIVAGWIISGLLKLDRMVCQTNEQVTTQRTELMSKLDCAKTCINKTLNALNSFVTFINEKKCECKEAFETNIVTSILCLILKLPFKQILSALEVVLTIKKILR